MSVTSDRIRGFTNVLAVASLCVTAGLWSRPARALEPDPFPYGETTTILVEAFGEHLRPPGFPPEGIPNDDAFIEWMVAYSLDIPLRDFNGDNLIDCMDIVDITVALLNAMRGDLNGDGKVDGADAAILTANLGMALQPDGPIVLITDGDLTAGYSVTLQDLEALMSRHGQELDDFAHVVAMQLVFDRPKSKCFESDWVAHNAYFSGSGWPGGHGVVASSFGHPPGHTTMHSNGPQPPGHHYDLSATWPGVDHSYRITGSGPVYPPAGWPPNHHAAMSNSWDSPHQTVTSQRWPPSHAYWVSVGWQQHSYDLSGAWGPNHRSDITTSGPVHIQNASVMIWPRSPHLQTLSATNPPNHNADNSQAWPPNHDAFVTIGWSPTHSTNTSVHWPSGHFYQVSNDWPPSTNPVWPPNHFASVSQSWGAPPPPSGPGFWPSDHAYVITILDILDVILPLP